MGAARSDRLEPENPGRRVSRRTPPSGTAPDALSEELRAELREVTAALDRLRELQRAFPVRVGARIQGFLDGHARTNTASRVLLWPLEKLLSALQRVRRAAALDRWVDRLLFLDPSEYWIYQPGVRRLLRDYLLHEIHEHLGAQRFPGAALWFDRYRPTQALLGRLRSRVWPAYAPTFTVVLRAGAGSRWRLDRSVASVVEQVYPRWELLSLGAADPGALLSDPRVRAVDVAPESGAGAGRRAAVDQARGNFVCWLDAGDSLEPQAFYRFAEAVLDTGADLLYSDEVLTGDDPRDVVGVRVCPQFSYDHYLSRAYFGKLVGIRRSLLRDADPIDLATDDGAVLRALERAAVVAHIPDILCRRRADSVAPGAAEAERAARVRRHLSRLGYQAEVAPTEHPECLDVRYRPSRPVRIAIIVPTKNRVDLLRRCVETLEKTVPPDLATIHVVDHESDDPEALAYLDAIRGRHRVLPYQGRFNFSRINNHAVHRCEPGFTHYLFLNNDIEAHEPGWLEHMASLGQRADVGVVGAILLYPDRTVQHAGTMIGLHFAADHAHESVPAYDAIGRRLGGQDLGLLATRELSAVTGACMLVSAEAFHAAGGFDVSLAVGFGDTDLCLRIRALGYKVLLDTRAVLTHLGSATRGKDKGDPHPLDTQLLRTRYLQMIVTGDPFFSPFQSRGSSKHLNPGARCREVVLPRVARVALPRLSGQGPGSAPTPDGGR